MAHSVIDVMRARYWVLMHSIKMLEKQMSNYSEGSINIKRHNGRAYYYLHSQGKDTYLSTKDTVHISQMIQKDLIRRTLKAAKNEAEILKKNIIGYPKTTMEKVYDTLPEGRKNMLLPSYSATRNMQKSGSQRLSHQGLSVMMHRNTTQ